MNKIKKYISKHDKEFHFIAGYLIALTVVLLAGKEMKANNPYVFKALPLLAAFVIGFAKEFIWEWFNKSLFSWKDLLYTVLGGLSVNLIILI